MLKKLCGPLFAAALVAAGVVEGATDRLLVGLFEAQLPLGRLGAGLKFFPLQLRRLDRHLDRRTHRGDFQAVAIRRVRLRNVHADGRAEARVR